MLKILLILPSVCSKQTSLHFLYTQSSEFHCLGEVLHDSCGEKVRVSAIGGASRPTAVPSVSADGARIVCEGKNTNLLMVTTGTCQMRTLIASRQPVEIESSPLTGID